MFVRPSNVLPGGNESQNREALRIYRFACILTANERLAYPLFRDSGVSVSRPLTISTEVYTQFYKQWDTRTAIDTGLQHTFPPEPRLFATEPKRGVPAGNTHLSKFFAHMPWQQRAALYLVYGERFSYDVAAEIAHLSVQALMKRLAKGHAALASWQEHHGLRADGEGVREMGRAA